MTKDTTSDGSDSTDELITDGGEEQESEQRNPEAEATSCTTIHSNAAQFYAFADLVGELVDECRLHVREDGLHVTAVDPANVGMIDVHAAGGGFDRYLHSGEEAEIGLDVGRLKSALDPARKGQGVDGGDPVTLRIDPDTDADGDELMGQFTVTVERDDVHFRSNWYGLNPAAVRKEPELLEPDERVGWHATPDPLTFRDALTHIDGQLDHTWISGDGEALFLGGRGDLGGAAVRFEDCAWQAPPESVEVADEDAFETEHADDAGCFSLNYLAGFAATIRKARMDRLRLSWGDEWPAVLRYEQPDWGISGQYVLAPRITDDDADVPTMSEWEEPTEVESLAD